MKKIIYLLTVYHLTMLYAQNPFYLEDLNPNSETYGQIISPADFSDDICVVFFGHES